MMVVSSRSLMSDDVENGLGRGNKCRYRDVDHVTTCAILVYYKLSTAIIAFLCIVGHFGDDEE